MLYYIDTNYKNTTHRCKGINKDTPKRTYKCFAEGIVKYNKLPINLSAKYFIFVVKSYYIFTIILCIFEDIIEDICIIILTNYYF